MHLRLATPAGFSFQRTVFSHGWCDLPPFQAEGPGGTLASVVPLAHGGAARVVLSYGGAGAVVLETPGAPAPAVRRDLAAAARRMLGLDVDLDEFHAVVARDPRHAWIAATGAGRMLRAPTMFEDVVKLVLTTNCSWAATKRMAGTLVGRYGEVTPEGARSFPTAARLARVRERSLRDVVRAGYRAPFLASLARRVASGEVDLAAWDDDPRPSEALRMEMMTLPGVGPYVAENLLKFLGRPHGLALDSWMRSKYARVHHGGRAISDTTILRRVAPLGRWAGLALWFDLTRDWLEGDEPSSAWATLS